MSNLFTFEKVGPKATGEIRIFKRPPVTPRQTNGKPIIIEEGNVIAGYPNIIPILKNNQQLHEIPILINWLELNQSFKNKNLEEIQKALFKDIFTNPYAFKSIETKRIDFTRKETLLIESVGYGAEYNFPAFSLFLFNNNILGFNPESLSGGKFSPISKINYYNIKIDPYRDKDFSRIGNLVQPTKIIMLNNTDFINNPETLEFYFLLNTKKEFKLIDQQNIKLNSNALRFLFEYLVRIEDYIEYIRNFQLPEVLNFAEKISSFIKSNLQVREIKGWPYTQSSHEYGYPISFPIDYISFFKKSFWDYSPGFLVSRKSEVSIFFEKNKFFLNQVFIIVSDLKVLKLLITFLDSWKNDLISILHNENSELQKIKQKNPEKMEKFSQFLDDLSIEIRNDFINSSESYTLKYPYGGPKTDLQNKIIEFHEFFNFSPFKPLKDIYGFFAFLI